MIDVLLYQTFDDGDVLYKNGDLTYDQTYATASYLSLFGGNKEDEGSQDSKNQFWGNSLVKDTASKYRSETQHLLQDTPLNTANLLAFEEVAKRDLNWLIEENLAKKLEVSASIPSLNRVLLTILIDDLILKFNLEKIYGNTYS